MFYREPDRQSYPTRAARWMRLIGYDRVERKPGTQVDCVRYRTSVIGNFRIVFFSDLHYFDSQKNCEIVRETMEWIRRLKPEYLLFGGDFVADACDLEALRNVMRQFGELPGIKLAVTGNWERGKDWLPEPFWKNFYADAGVRLLDDEIYSDENIWIFGISDRRASIPPHELPGAPADRPILLLAHNPDTVAAVDENGRLNSYDLVLCGHTHGGQIRLPKFGAPFTSSRYRNFDYGEYLHRNNRTRMVISSGLGNRSVNFRFGCRREVVLVDLKRPN